MTGRGVLWLCLYVWSCVTVRAEKRGYDFGVWESVPPDYHWNHRHQGITHYWNPSLAIWKHYDNLTSLLEHPLDPEPWTQGRVVQNWIQVNATASELWSLYEPSSVGHWPIRHDHHHDNTLLHAHHVYTQTPFSLTHMPGVRLPASVQLPEGHDTSRLTRVQPHVATYRGPRWLPTAREAATLQYLYEQGSQTRRHHHIHDHDAAIHRRWCFSELWLADDVHGVPAGRSMGLFVQYHGLTGELLQLICMRERSMLPTTRPDDLVDYNPQMDCDLDRMELELRKLDDRTERAVLKTPAARALANGDSIERVLELGQWTNFNARIVQSKGLLGPEIACVLEDRPASELVYASPFLNQPDCYLDLRWRDGMYARIPKRMIPEMEEICFEIGGLTAKGDFHRLMAVGSRSSGSLHTTVYERWSKTQSPWGVGRQSREAKGRNAMDHPDPKDSR